MLQTPTIRRQLAFLAVFGFWMGGRATAQIKAERPQLKIPLGHSLKITGADISMDNRYIATGSEDNTVILWDAITGTEIRTITLARAVSSVLFSPDSKRIYAMAQASGKSGLLRRTITCWDVKTGERLDSLPFYCSGKGFQISPSGKYLLVQGFYQEPKNGMANAADSAEAGRALMMGGWTVWDLEKAVKIFSAGGVGSGDMGFAWQNGTECLVTAGRVRENPKLPTMQDPFDITDAYRQARADYVQDSLKYVPADADYLRYMKARYAGKTTGPDSTGYFMAKLQEKMGDLAKYQGEMMGERMKAYSHAIAAAYISSTIDFIDFQHGGRPDDVSPLKQLHPEGKVKAMAVAGSGQLLTTVNDSGRIDIWDVAKGKVIGSVGGSSKKPPTIQLSADGNRVLLVSTENDVETIVIRDLIGNSVVMERSFPRFIPATVVRMSANGRFFVLAGEDLTDKVGSGLLYTADGVLVRALTGHADQVRSYVFSTDGRDVLTDHGYFPPPLAARQQYKQEMQGIIREYTTKANAKGSKTNMDDYGRFLDQLNQQQLKRVAMQKTTKNYRVWDLVRGKVVADSAAAGVAFGKDTVSARDSLLLTSVLKRTMWSGMTATRPDSAAAARQPGNRTTGDNIAAAINMAVERQTRGTGIDLGKEMADQNSQINRVFSQEALLVKKRRQPDTVSLISVDSLDWVMVNREGYFMCSRNSARELRYELNGKVYFFDQFDLQYNRPDKVLESIGLAPDSVIARYRHLYEARVRSMHFSPDSLDQQMNFDAPVVRLGDSSAVYAVSKEREYTFPVRADDALYPVKWLRIFVNGAPENGVEGLDVGNGGGRSVSRNIKLQLSRGKNMIEVSAMNDRGVSSYTERFEVDYTAQ